MQLFYVGPIMQLFYMGPITLGIKVVILYQLFFFTYAILFSLFFP